MLLFLLSSLESVWMFLVIPLLTVATAEAMLAAGFSADDVDRVLWRNPVEFYGQSGKLDLSDIPAPEATFAGSSILRGGS